MACSYAQDSAGERIRERIREKWLQKKQQTKGESLKNLSPIKFGAYDYEFSFEHDGIMRLYRVHLPSNYNKETPTPMVIYVHGGGGNSITAYREGMDKKADKHGFILAAPQGFYKAKRENQKASFLSERMFSWNGGKWDKGECCGNADDVGFISKMIDEIKGKFNVDEKRIYATGISNGGLMTNRLGCELSDKIAAIGTVAPAAVESNCNPSRVLSVIDIHGTLDPANPHDGSEPRSIFDEESSGIHYKRMTPYQVVDAWKKIDKCSDSQIKGYEKGSAKCMIYNDCESGAEVELCIVEGMGHTWPSGSQYLPLDKIGPVSYDISFDQIWEFFKKHPMKDE